MHFCNKIPLHFYAQWVEIRCKIFNSYQVKREDLNWCRFRTSYVYAKTTDAQRGNRLHCTPTPKFLATAQFFRYLWFMPSLGVRSSWLYVHSLILKYSWKFNFIQIGPGHTVPQHDGVKTTKKKRYTQNSFKIHFYDAHG